MAFAESDRVQIRLYLGYPQIWVQADPRLESAITNIQSIHDTPPGTRPDGPPSSAETQAKLLVTQLQQVDTSLNLLDSFSGAYEASKATAKVDAAREDARLRAKGRMLVNRLAAIFDTTPGRDVFSVAPDADESRGPGMPQGPFGGRRGY